MRAMVLAAGRGERLRPLTESLPKPLIPLGGKPLLDYTLTYLRNCGIDEVVINLHHLASAIRDFVGDGSRWGLRVVYSFERTLLGTGGGIQKAAPHLVGDTFVVMNADIVLEVDLREVLRFHREKQGSVTLVLRQDPDVERYGVIEIDADCRVREFLGRLGLPRRPRKRLMFTGLHILEPTVFSYMPVDRPSFSITDVYVEMIRAGETVLGYEMKGFWTDLGTRERYRLMQRMIERNEISLERLASACCGSGLKTP